jgi:hypothetical protein
MSNENFDLTIKKGEFLILTSAELDSFMLENEFSEKTKKQILKICKEFNWSDVLLFFLNYTRHNYTLDCFMPIYNDETSLPEDKAIRDINNAVCLPPQKLKKQVIDLNRNEIEAIKRKAYSSANWTEEYGFGIQEDGMPTIRMDIAPYAKKPITRGSISSGAMRKPTAKKPTAKAAAKKTAAKIAAKKPARKATRKPVAKIAAKKPLFKAVKKPVKKPAKKPTKKAVKKPAARAMCR